MEARINKVTVGVLLLLAVQVCLQVGRRSLSSVRCFVANLRIFFI